jgi:hypothetical protein
MGYHIEARVQIPVPQPLVKALPGWRWPIQKELTYCGRTQWKFVVHRARRAQRKRCGLA